MNQGSAMKRTPRRCSSLVVGEGVFLFDGYTSATVWTLPEDIDFRGFV